MTERGRHARRSSTSFYRDVFLLVAGILLVGAIVFGGLSLWAGRDGGGSDDTSTTSAPSTTLVTTSSTTPSTPTSSTSATTTSTGAPATTLAPSSTTTQPPTTVRPERETSEVSAVVLNSIGVPGLAGSLTDELAGLGYQMSPPDNYTPELSDTMIFHAEGSALEALTLAEAIPDGTVASNADLTGEWGVDVVVVIGQSYQE